MSPTASITLVPSSAPGSQAFMVLDMPFWPIIRPCTDAPSASCNISTDFT